MHPKDADSMANGVDPGQTAPLEQSDLGLHLLPGPVCLNTYYHYDNTQGIIDFYFTIPLGRQSTLTHDYLIIYARDCNFVFQFHQR